YPAVDLGLYCWTAQNLRTEHYADNTDVPNIMTYSAAGYSPSDLLDVFGHLYTWNAATQYNSGQGICPDGWHIPTDAEMEYVIATYTPEELMATTQWLPIPGTDISQFTLLPGGRYNSTYGLYENLLVNSYVWTIREESTHAIACMFGAACGTSEFISSEKANGHSVRCVLNY
ncbi:MAG: fibrobacter succinogenes major paralogous domain-containing protein, partial [Bacteroidales bacterium]|nr:fibrobacter succinogenes major paralogous domain-containing protein [Bacteroidales bacterium]